MKSALPFALALILLACHEEPTMTFGLDVRYRDSKMSAEQALRWCSPPGEYDGSASGISIDNWEIDEPPPHLFLETAADAEENVYRVRVYLVSEVDKDGFLTKPSAVPVQRSYDSKFAESGGTDSFVVDFEAEQYTVEVRGLPPSATCP